MKSLAVIIASPTLCLAVLAGISVEKWTHAQPQDAAPFHARARAAIEAWPDKIGDEWVSKTTDIPEAAVKLLRPNVILSRRYFGPDNQVADLLVVQCREPGDMSGHYPPNCYPGNGEKMVFAKERTWTVENVAVRGMEYHFEIGAIGRLQRRCVYNFFVLPGRGIVPDMKDVRQASGDYQRRYFGAAQFQVVFPPDNSETSQEKRDGIFKTILGSDLPALQMLNPEGI